MTGIGSKALQAWLLVLLCVALIWTFSGESFSAVETSRILTPLLRWLYPEISGRTIFRVHLFVRKAAHLTEYAVLAALAFRAVGLSLELSTPRLIALAFGLVTAVSAADELRQSLLAARTGSPVDVVVDLAGGALGVALVVAFRGWLRIASPAAQEDP